MKNVSAATFARYALSASGETNGVRCVITGVALGLLSALSPASAQAPAVSAADGRPLVTIKELMEKTIAPATNRLWNVARVAERRGLGRARGGRGHAARRRERGGVGRHGADGQRVGEATRVEGFQPTDDQRGSCRARGHPRPQRRGAARRRRYPLSALRGMPCAVQPGRRERAAVKARPASQAYELRVAAGDSRDVSACTYSVGTFVQRE